MSFAHNLKYIKEKLGATNYQLAKLFECSQSSLINWLDGGVTPHTKTRKRIADHFGITLEELDGDELPVLPSECIKKGPIPKDEANNRMNPDYLKLNAANRAAIDAAIAAFLAAQQSED